MSDTFTPVKVNFKLSPSQQAKARRVLLEHYKEIIAKRGYTLSVQEVDAEIASMQRKAKAGNLDDQYELMAAQIGII
jgi:hypothetical protein